MVQIGYAPENEALCRVGSGDDLASRCGGGADERTSEGGVCAAGCWLSLVRLYSKGYQVADVDVYIICPSSGHSAAIR